MLVSVLAFGLFHAPRRQPLRVVFPLAPPKRSLITARVSALAGVDFAEVEVRVLAGKK